MVGASTMVVLLGVGTATRGEFIAGNTPIN
jgi:hypothetical protein